MHPATSSVPCISLRARSCPYRTCSHLQGTSRSLRSCSTFLFTQPHRKGRPSSLGYSTRHPPLHQIQGSFLRSYGASSGSYRHRISGALVGEASGRGQPAIVTGQAGGLESGLGCGLGSVACRRGSAVAGDGGRGSPRRRTRRPLGGLSRPYGVFGVTSNTLVRYGSGLAVWRWRRRTRRSPTGLSVVCTRAEMRRWGGGRAVVGRWCRRTRRRSAAAHGHVPARPGRSGARRLWWWR